MRPTNVQRRSLQRGLIALLLPVLLTTACVDEPGRDGQAAGDGIKVGVLHSLSGTMAISEVTVRDAELLAIEEINAAGGVLGEKLVPVTEDGASDWPTFAEKAQKLISQDRVAAVFGGWTSASRKAMLPVFERNKALLWYPVQYEGLESSPYIFYTGATTNQQIVPALDYLAAQGRKRMFLVGSDYVFPRTANKIIKAYAAAKGIEVLGEEYTPLGHTEYSTLVNKIADAEPDAVFNTLNGDSNVAFFKQLRGSGITPDTTPVVSVSVAEEEVRGIGPENVAGHLVAWNYYQTTATPANEAFVKAFKAKYGADKVTSDPMEAGYNAVHLWAAAVKKAGTTEVEAVRKAAGGISIEAPEGTTTIDGDNQHVAKTARIGVVRPDGQIEEVWASDAPIEPDPYLKGYDWAGGLG
ncbi:urea ABC transporter substrate-binding protein [Saccharothrix sp. Mg75]|uniref:urea ABC transporter substrate-binding protein n=1 Tax=Saccharothrix sp. Mg75 TaxID=3445357 RepID=UPI003EED769A